MATSIFIGIHWCKEQSTVHYSHYILCSLLHTYMHIAAATPLTISFCHQHLVTTWCLRDNSKLWYKSASKKRNVGTQFWKCLLYAYSNFFIWKQKRRNSPSINWSWLTNIAQLIRKTLLLWQKTLLLLLQIKKGIYSILKLRNFVSVLWNLNTR